MKNFKERNVRDRKILSGFQSISQAKLISHVCWTWHFSNVELGLFGFFQWWDYLILMGEWWGLSVFLCLLNYWFLTFLLWPGFTGSLQSLDTPKKSKNSPYFPRLLTSHKIPLKSKIGKSNPSQNSLTFSFPSKFKLNN